MVESGSSQELEMHIPSVKEFCFDPEKQLFITRTINSNVEKELKDISDIFDLNTKPADRDKNRKQQDHTLGLGPLATLIEFPNLRKWISNLSQKQKIAISEKVLSTMEKVYRDLNQNSIAKLPKNIRGGLFSFNAILKEDGRFDLSTFGNCACLGANSDPTFISYDTSKLRNLSDPTLPVEYYLHNADTPARRLSLYAGAGTIAWLKNQAINPNKPKAF